MNNREFLTHVRGLGIDISAVGDRLHVKGPKKALSAHLRSELDARKPAILQILGYNTRPSTSTAPDILHVSRDSAPRLSFAQERLWFLNQLDPNSVAYNVTHALRLNGPLNVAALEQSTNEILRRHEILRSTIVTVNGEPRLNISPSSNGSLHIIDLTSLNGAQREAEARHIAESEFRRPFDLTRGPLFRETLVRLEDEHHLLLLTLHHIVTDGWSTALLFRELGTLYSAFLSGKPSPLTDIPVQYADYAQWQRRSLVGPVLESQLSYWRKQLAGIPAVFTLPTDRPRPPMQSYKGAQESITLARALVAELKAMSRANDVTLFMTLLAAFQTLLSRYSGQEDVVVGSPIANRDRPEIERVIGFFANTLVLRSDLSGQPTFNALLARVRKLALEAYEHQDVPFERLVDDLHPERNLGRTPLFQVLFVLQNTPRHRLKMPGLIVSPIEIEAVAAKFDLSFELWEEGQEITGSITYNTDLFDAATIKHVADHYQTLLKSIVANPGQPISELTFLTNVERHELLVERNASKRSYPQDKGIHKLFEEQVEKTPTALALSFKNQRITYRELNGQANQLAHHLRKLGVTPGSLVGLCVERSPALIVGLLAILKAGCAYVPIDPDYPEDRINYMVESAKAPVLIIGARATGSPLPNTKVVCLASDQAAIDRRSDKNLDPLSGLDDVFYVIYTSGSTGRPKGAAIYQRGFLNLLHWFTTEFSITAQDRVLLVTSPSFDLTQKNIFSTLITGGELHILPGKQYDPETITQLIAERNITLMNCTPSAFYPLVEQRENAKLATLNSLRNVFLGGEPISIPRLRPWLESDRCKCTIVNTYGPTECTDICASYTLTRENIDSHSFVPIGRPIDNVQLVVLDDHLRPCAPGVAGELYIAGCGLGAGYVNDPALTASKFIPNPFPELSGNKIYRTGDRVRLLSDGNLEFLERIDQQIKLRGFRVDLGEIETVLAQHPTVQESVVVARDEAFGDRRLVAYIVSAQHQESPTHELRAFLQQKLPDYMIPADFIALKEIPLTAHGKLDRRALPGPEQKTRKLGNSRVAPRDDLELQLTKIWEKHLAVNPIGVQDNFFHLGGNSLMAVSLIDQIEKTLNRHLSLAVFFQAPTIEELANVIRQNRISESSSALMPIQRNSGKRPFFCVQGSADLARNLGTDQPFYVLRPAALEGQYMSSKVEDIAAEFVREIREIQRDGPYLLGGFSFGGKVAFEMAQQLNQQGQEVRLLALFDPSLTANRETSSALGSIPPISRETELRLRDALRSHWHKLADLSLNRKALYLWNGVKWRIEGHLSNIITLYKKIECHLYLITGHRLPPRLRIFYFVRVSGHALQRYIPKIYPGRVIVFPTEAMASDARSEWEKLSGGGVELHVVPGNHSNVLKEPSVRIWAEHLRNYLDNAQVTE